MPVYNPELIYGVWPYPGFPPYYFPGYFDGVILSGFGWIGVTVVAPLWRLVPMGLATAPHQP